MLSCGAISVTTHDVVCGGSLSAAVAMLVIRLAVRAWRAL